MKKYKLSHDSPCQPSKQSHIHLFSSTIIFPLAHPISEQSNVVVGEAVVEEEVDIKEVE